MDFNLDWSAAQPSPRERGAATTSPAPGTTAWEARGTGPARGAT